MSNEPEKPVDDEKPLVADGGSVIDNKQVVADGGSVVDKTPSVADGGSAIDNKPVVAKPVVEKPVIEKPDVEKPVVDDDDDEPVPRIPRTAGFKVSTAALVRIAMTGALLAMIIVARGPCADSVSSFVVDFDNAGGSASTHMPKPGNVDEPSNLGSAGDYETLTPNMTEAELKAAIERAKAKSRGSAGGSGSAAGGGSAGSGSGSAGSSSAGIGSAGSGSGSAGSGSGSGSNGQ